MPYYSIFAIAVVSVILNLRFQWSWKGWAWLGFICLLFLFVGVRHEVGADWGNYLAILGGADGAGFLAALSYGDPAYAFFNWIGANGGGGIYLVNAVCAALSVGALAAFCDKMSQPALAMLVAIPYLLIVVFMGYTRQGVAVGFGMLAILAVFRRDTLSFVLWVVTAALFHRTAVILFIFCPAIYLPKFNIEIAIKLSAIFSGALALSLLLFGPHVQFFMNLYIHDASGALGGSDGALYLGERPAVDEGTGVNSLGAIPRLMQSLLAVACFVFIAWRTRLEPAKFWLWTIASVMVAGLFMLSFWKSTLADRTGLFFLPLQIYAFSTLPDLFKPPLSFLLTVGVIVGSGSSLWVWLNYGAHAQAWFPYRSALEFWF